MSSTGFVSPRPGDRASFDELMREHDDFLREAIEKQIDARLRAVLDTEDVIDDVSIAAYRAIEHADLPTAASFRLWLERLTTERLADLTKRQFGTHNTVDPEHSRMHPSVIATRREEAEALEQVLADIPARDREMIRLIHVERLPPREIAARTGKTRSEVRKSIARALDACHQALAEEKRST